ncbi:MAG: hypothetical protein JNL32_11880 [Candidatus Kapabacteria bacterium]|nr:hypothetical protein [Candidatus Kapabacteria bacterium]
MPLIEPVNPDNWVMYLYSSNTRIGLASDNYQSCVPLASFPSGSLDAGVPKTPEWIAFETYGLFARDVGDKELQKRAGKVLVEVGEYRIGGRMIVLAFDFNTSMTEYMALLKALRRPYKYLWMNNYDAASQIISTPATNALRFVCDVPESENDDAVKPFEVNWYKYAPEML